MQSRKYLPILQVHKLKWLAECRFNLLSTHKSKAQPWFIHTNTENLYLIYKEIQILHPNLALHIHKSRLIWNACTPSQWIHFLLCLCKLATATVIEYHIRCRIIVMQKQGHVLWLYPHTRLHKSLSLKK